MPQVRVYVSIPLPVEEVFGYLADGCNLAAWHSGVMSVRPDGPAGGPAGECAYRYRFPGRRRECVLTRVVCEPPVRVGFAGQRMWTPLGWQVPRFDFRLWPWEGGGCRVEVGVQCVLGGAMVLLWPVVACGWRRDLPVDAQALYEGLTGGGEREAEAAVAEVRRAAGGGPTDSTPAEVPPAAPAGAGSGTRGGPEISTDPGFGPAEPAWRQAAGARPFRPPRPVCRFRLPAPHG